MRTSAAAGKRLPVLFAVCALASTARAATLRLDCYLPSGQVDCRLLERALFSADDRFQPELDAAKAAHLLKVRETDLPQKILLEAVRSENGQAAPPETRELEKAQTPDAKLLAALELCRAALKPVAGGDAVPDLSGASTWYVAPKIDLQLKSSEILDVTAMAGAYLNWSTPRWRVQLGPQGSYRRITIPQADGTRLTGELATWDAAVHAARSLPGGWSVAAALDAHHLPADNRHLLLAANAGFEWSLHPFLRQSERNVTVRYAIGWFHDEYILRNERGRMVENFPSHNATAYFVWHFDRADLNAYVGAASIVHDLRHSTLLAGLTASLRVTQSLYIQPTFSGMYRHRMIQKPANPDDSNPIQVFVMGGNFSRWFFQTGLSLKYYFGTPRPDDQRWRDAVVTPETW